jgi:hypothetical protein
LYYHFLNQESHGQVCCSVQEHPNYQAQASSIQLPSVGSSIPKERPVLYLSAIALVIASRVVVSSLIFFVAAVLAERLEGWHELAWFLAAEMKSGLINLVLI